MTRHAGRIAVALAFTCAIGSIAQQSSQVERWADTRLQVTEGLVLWLDASRMSAARQAQGRLPLGDGDPVDVWYDGSGHGRHCTQGFPKSRPTFLAAGEAAAIRFDGLDDCLSATGPKQGVEEFTIVLLAAPRSNSGVFRALLAANETGKNDYVTGINIDLGPAPSQRFERLNVEGRGFGGAVNLMKESHPFNDFHVMTVRGRPGKGGAQLFVDGKPMGQRERGPGAIRLDQITLGARFYSNTADAPSWHDFFDGDLAEVVKLVDAGQLSLDGLLTHRRPASDAPSAYSTAFEDPACLKMVLDWSLHQ